MHTEMLDLITYASNTEKRNAKAEMDFIAQQIADHLFDFSLYTMSHLCRNANEASHFLAQLASSGDFTWVSVPGTNLLNIVTVRCGHCANLLPVNINGALPQTIPPPHPQGHNVGQQGSHLECESSTRCNRISLFNSMVNNDQHDMNSTHQPSLTPLTELLLNSSPLSNSSSTVTPCLTAAQQRALAEQLLNRSPLSNSNSTVTPYLTAAQQRTFAEQLLNSSPLSKQLLNSGPLPNSYSTEPLPEQLLNSSPCLIAAQQRPLV
ncbi:Protein YABBY 2 [Apostasia shenzhenica]|uniref:Protein YABBY 2 n=1 Tax=Apostasia shenzhenica TaxID=1088818 RepID=A0A2I0B2V9_9ASPA|nr:Protein YABBY 2 [Apostasia shenzhenica]